MAWYGSVGEGGTGWSWGLLNQVLCYGRFWGSAPMLELQYRAEIFLQCLFCPDGFLPYDLPEMHSDRHNVSWDLSPSHLKMTTTQEFCLDSSVTSYTANKKTPYAQPPSIVSSCLDSAPLLLVDLIALSMCLVSVKKNQVTLPPFSLTWHCLPLASEGGAGMEPRTSASYICTVSLYPWDTVLNLQGRIINLV